MSGRAVGVAWFRREDYQRIREISDDEMVPTFDEFEAKMTRQLSNQRAASTEVVPAALLACLPFPVVMKDQGGRLTAHHRGESAASLAIRPGTANCQLGGRG